MTFKTVTRNYIQNSSRRAFTLVELLVVIAIISILVGLLMPAVMNAQNEARRAQCQENLRNVAMALVNFESSKNYFPGYVQSFRGANTTWFTMILEQLGAGDLYKTIATGGSLSETPHLSVLNCPSDSRVKCRQSYRINGGMNGSGTGNDKKYRVSGLSFNLNGSEKNNLKIGIGQIVDGAANTILVGENANNRADWRTATGQYQNCIMYKQSASPTAWGSETQDIINRNMDSTDDKIVIARPSSRHRGIALVAFADTHVISLKDSIQYNTYKMIMCPNDNGLESTFGNPNNSADKRIIDISQVDNNYP